MAHTLVDFIRAKVSAIHTYAAFDRNLPEGFNYIVITAETGEWWTEKAAACLFLTFGSPLTLRSARRTNWSRRSAQSSGRCSGVVVALSTASISRGLLMPHGIEKPEFNFDFDRVFWFVSLGAHFVEIQKAERSA